MDRNVFRLVEGRGKSVCVWGGGGGGLQSDYESKGGEFAAKEYLVHCVLG